MNAKKIMGAVLVALLAAALFTGAVAAVEDKGTYYTYVPISGLNNGETFSYGESTIMAQPVGNGVGFAISEGSYIKGATYSNGSIKFKLATPNANVYITDKNGKDVVGGTVLTTDLLNFTVGLDKLINDSSLGSTVPALDYTNMIFIDSDGVETIRLPGAFNETDGSYNISKVVEGKWGVKVDISSKVAQGGPKYSSVYYFTITDVTETIAADKTEVLIGGTVVVSVTGAPGQMNITYDPDYLTVIDDQPGVITNTGYVADKKVGVTVGTEGKASVAFTANKSGSTTVKIDDDKKVSVTIKKGTITGTVETDSVYIGNDVKLSGTYEGGKKVHIYIAGTNFKFQELKSADVKSDNTWKATIQASEIVGPNGEKPDAGTYTIYVASNSGAQNVSALTTYGTISLALKQPFISITDAPTVAVQGTDYKVTGTAEAATSKGVKYYIFGTNYFDQGSEAVEKGEFEIETFIESTMAAGQYFMVVQHPMYDEEFNIQINGTAPHAVYLYDSNGNKIGAPLFNVTDRQKTNAAQALCDALDTQNIDDMYVKLSFVVAAPSSVINPIPSEVTKGSKLTVSGTTNVGEGEVVTVEMISTAFAAQPKDMVGSASFIALTTKTDENGNWEVTFDTTGLNVDEYTVTAAVGQLGSATAKVNVIEGAPTEQPTTQPTETQQPTTQPTETEAPTTPGFGALAALAGLGAVAVLLLRRK